MSPFLISIIVFLMAYALIASEKIEKAIAAVFGAAAMVLLGAADFEFMLGKIDLNVLGLLVGMMIIVNIMATTGVFEWLAIKIAKQTRGNGILVTLEFLAATAVVSALMDNVTTVILMTPVTILIGQLLRLPVVPILICEAVFSNIGGTATLIGDPPNILIGASCGLSFNEFIINLAPVVLLIGVVCAVAVLFALRKDLHSDPEAVREVMRTEPQLAILQPQRLRRSLIVFAAVLLGFATSRWIRVEPGLIAVCGAFAMILTCGMSLPKMLEKVEWPTIIFFCGLFMMVAGLEANGVFIKLGEEMLGLTRGNYAAAMLVILWSAAIFSAIVDNIPLVIAMIPLIMGIVPAFVAARFPGVEISAENIRTLLMPDVIAAYAAGGADAVAGKLAHPEVLALLSPEQLAQIADQIVKPLLWALALGACLGGNGTLIGASANVVIAQIANRNHYPLTFARFTKYGFPLMLLSTAISTVYLYFRYLR